MRYHRVSQTLRYLWAVITNGAVLLFISSATFCYMSIVCSMSVESSINAANSDFYRLVVEGDTFVDKSLLIEEYLRRWKSKILITRPRQWGKTVNIDMLRRYLEIELNKNGEQLPEEERVYRKLFLGGTVTTGGKIIVNGSESAATKTLKPLKLCKFEYIANQQGEYPVIFLSLKNLSGANYEQFERNVIKYARSLFANYSYLKENQTDEDKTIFEQFTNEAGNVTIDLLKRCVEILSRMLERRFNRKVHILVDDYDAPLLNLLNDFVVDEKSAAAAATVKQNLTDVLNSKDYLRSAKLLGKILGNALNFNSALEMAFLTGTYPLEDTPLVGQLETISDYSLLKKPFTEYYGFSRPEIDELTVRLSARGHRKMLKLWCNGYNMAGIAMYNPYSVTRLLEVGKPADYWVQAGSLGYAEEFIRDDSFKGKLEDLLYLRRIDIPKRNFSKQFFTYLPNNDRFRYLLMNGYLSLWPDTKTVHTIWLKIPNDELRWMYINWLVQDTANRYNLTVDDLKNGTKLLYKGYISEFKDWFTTTFNY